MHDTFSRYLIGTNTASSTNTFDGQLAELVLSLRAFEDYSAQCEDRNPADAALHRYLWRSAGQARALFEEAMERVADAEGIDLDQ